MPRNGASSSFRAGARAAAPLLLGMAPFGAVAGIATVEAGLSPLQGQAMSVIVFAGAAQLAALQLIENGAAALVVVATALIINLRLAMYSASLAPHLQHLSPRQKLPLAYALTDQAYAVAVTRFGEGLPRTERRSYYLGAAGAIWATWQTATAAGLFVGAGVPEAWDLSFAVPLTFMALLVPALKDRPAVAAAAVGGFVAAAAFALPFNLELIVAALSGIGAGLLAEKAVSVPEEDAP